VQAGEKRHRGLADPAIAAHRRRDARESTASGQQRPPVSHRIKRRLAPVRASCQLIQAQPPRSAQPGELIHDARRSHGIGFHHNIGQRAD